METTQLIWIIAVTLLSLLNIVWQLDLQTRMKRLEERYRRLSGASVEETGPQVGLGTLLAQIGSVRDRVERLERQAQQAQVALGHAVQGVGMVRFRALPDVGGDQSFSLALVDGEGNGVVLSALYLREGTRFYGKPLAGWNSPYPLTDEERQALDQARKAVEGSRG
ncbi:MAG: DUF4446 family protein [Anaerolineae bacterium]|nr:DUF4446 family protein [Anaerolineae bacterium]MCX8066658.1 DUF4446 family protein [Anaerolineae bacterium]MDW7991048.1 DUF4446 family protein [Anaerolineae bacterium]